ncbi:MAG: OmpA family protein [Deltaproteobacteria bacterium]|nr:OmpA family protein [Deltaproteobacteria bacterium]
MRRAGLTVFFILFFVAAAAYAADLRETDYLYQDGAITWQVEPSHVVCSGCFFPPEPLSYHPTDVGSLVVRVKASSPIVAVEPVGNNSDAVGKAAVVPNLEEVKQILAGLKTEGEPLKNSEPVPNLPKDSYSKELKGCSSSTAQTQVLEQSPSKTLATVYFAFGSYRLKEGEMQKIQNIVKEVKGKKVSVRGYTCDIGTKERNDILAIKRAGAVYEALLKNGITASLMTMSGEGKCCYAGSNKNENRRVEIITHAE